MVALIGAWAWPVAEARAQEQPTVASEAGAEDPEQAQRAPAGDEEGGPAAEPDDEPLAPIEVVVQGSGRAPTDELRDPTVATYVLRDEPLRAAGQSTAEALARVPGVQATRRGSSSDMATASVRGASSAQTPIYLAGVRLNDDLTGSVDLSTVPLWLLDRVEVYRGNAPAGSDVLGFGGALYFEPRLPRGPEAGVGVGVGSFGEREGRFVYATGDHEASALVALRLHSAENDFDFVHDNGTSFDESDDYIDRRVNADSSTADLWSVSRMRLGSSGSVTVLLNGFAREAGAPGLQIIGARHARAEFRRVLGGVSARLPCSDSTTGCRLELSTGALLSEYQLTDPLGELGSATEQITAGQRVTERARATVDVTDWWKLSAGGLLELQRLGVDIERSASLRAERLTNRVDLGAELDPYEPLTIALSGALECHSTSAQGPEGSGGEACGVLEPVGRVGARWQALEPLSIFANVGRYVRVPTLGELHGVSAVVRGNPELIPEQGLSTDLGVTVSGSVSVVKGYGQLAGFARFADELIGYRRSSLGVIRPYNINSARVLGVELAAGASAWDTLRAAVALTALDPRDTSEDRLVTNDLLPYQARLSVAPELELSTPSGWPAISMDRASLTARYAHRSSRVADPAGLVILDEQGQLDLEAALWWHRERLRLRGRLANLLDQRSVDLVGYPLPGRSGHLSMEAWW